MLPRPVVGFFGLLTSWVDLQLIIDCAKAYPKSSVVVLGRTAVDVTSFKAHSNIHYLGEVPFADLPRYARGFDVGLIPFIVNDLTIAANPLKLLNTCLLAFLLYPQHCRKWRSFRSMYSSVMIEKNLSVWLVEQSLMRVRNGKRNASPLLLSIHGIPLPNP